MFLQENCRITFDPSISDGLYAVPVQIEDFSDESSTTPLSSVPLQFIVEIYPTEPLPGDPFAHCVQKPMFVVPTPAANSCRYLDTGRPFSFSIVPRSKNAFTM